MVSQRLNSTLLPNLWPSFVIFHVSQVKLRVLISRRLSQELWGVQVFSWGRWTGLCQGVMVGNLWQCSALNFPVAGASLYFLLLHHATETSTVESQGAGAGGKVLSHQQLQGRFPSPEPGRLATVPARCSRARSKCNNPSQNAHPGTCL